ncbi:hypothetical protein Q9L58_010366 [Maublancomyces gigas]|uniref:Uncharacterized protein n=1 Tax=Discina gigas TaxID=1032678 RepID=A0ABR3G4A4_9PEZI
MSKPGKKSKAWWTPKITLLEAELRTVQRNSWATPDDFEGKQAAKLKANEWRRTIRHAKWEYWEKVFKAADSGQAFTAIRASENKKAIRSLPDKHSISTLQGKCQMLWEALFPANVATPTFNRVGFLSPSTKDLSDTEENIAPQDIVKIIRQSKK